jgi:CheY-like chemotaxis protein
MMGGRIGVESVAGKGSTFVITLPADLGEPRTEGARTEARDGSPNTILVVDDDAAAQDLLRRFLEREGFHTVSATSGAAALRLAREIKPVAITLDVMMPRMDGWTVLSRLKSDPETAAIPVIIVSIIDDKSLGYSLGAADYLTKPIARERFSAVLDKYRCVTGNCPVLIVEDEEPVRRSLRGVLEKNKWRVFEAENGAAALEMMERETPELIILDLVMPEMDGFAFTVELRKRQEWRSIPVVVVTAKDLSAEERERLSGSAESVLRKGSYSYPDLLDEINRVCGRARMPEKQPQEQAR